MERKVKKSTKTGRILPKMRRIHIVNPAAGKGMAPQSCHADADEEIYTSTSAGAIAAWVRDALREDPAIHFIVHGGDGTLNDAVNGILEAGCGGSAALSIVAAGSGNDFARLINAAPKGTYPVDVMRCNGKYAVNMLNMGFDCDVVRKTEIYKKWPLLSGSMAYIAALADVLCHPFGRRMRIELEDGEVLEQDCTLCAVANGQFCGGGFRAASLADFGDGLLDVLIIKKVTRRKFLTLVGRYREGTHLDGATGLPIDDFRSVMEFRRCRSVRIGGITHICADGEITEASEARVEVVPGAVRFIVE